MDYLYYYELELIGRTLVVCEKPTAARRIAQALDDEGTPKSFREQGVPYFIARRGSEDLIVVSALGHLFTLSQSGGSWTYPMFSFRWVPLHEADKKKNRIRSFINVIEKLGSGVNGYVSACDYDMEGSLIAYMMLLHICGVNSLSQARRMKYSTLTDRDLVKAWEDAAHTLNFPLINAGRARHEVDWLFGINLSRALTLSVKNATGFYKMLSIGRVQGPTLNFIKEREVKIRIFVPTPFWKINAGTRIDGRKYPLEYDELRIETLREAEEIVQACRKKDGVVTTIRTKIQEQRPFPPFNLGDLQREAYLKFHYAPRTTLRAAERLYLNALISYPRTSSQRIPPSINIREILEGLRKRKEYSALVDLLLIKPSLRPTQGRKEDPAHPAIHPTGKNSIKLSKVDGHIYDLICRRFIASLGGMAVRRYIDTEVDVNGYTFHLKGSRVLERGWMTFYAPYIKEKDVALPSLREGQVISIITVEAVKSCTKPPARFNPSSLLKLMEEQMIGTKATRTDIIDTLFKRGYIEGKTIEITELGFTIVDTLDRYSPEILSVEMTRNLEQDLELIQTGDISSVEAVEKAIEVLKPILYSFKKNEKLIGAEINEALKTEAQRANTLGKCPVCKNGEIRVIRNRKTSKRFAGCNNYFNGLCSVSYPLPQNGKIQATGKTCMQCGAPIINVIRRGRRPWKLCINTDCPTKKKYEDDGNGG